jgi:branched-chain amino acid transport system permease protein
MHTLNVYIVPGLVVGCIYAIAASGLVMAYTTSGVLNLGYGAIAFTIALIYYELHTVHHTMGAWPALALCVLVIGPLIGMFLWQALFRWLTGLGMLASLIATIGLAIALPALCLMVFNPGQIFYAAGVPSNGPSLKKVGPATVSVDQMYAVGAAIIVAALLFYLLRFTVLGLKMRAVFDSASVASLTGASPNTISNLSWALSGGLAAIGGIFLAPLLGLSAAVFLSLTVASLAAALVGGLRSVAITFLAAILIGIISSAITGFNQNSSLLALGVQPSLPFLVMGATVLFRRRPIASGQAPRRALEPAERFDGVRAQVAKIAPAAVVLLLIPAIFDDYWTGVVGLGLIFSLIFLGFTLALGYGGLLPLGQGALVGIGGFIGGGLAASSGVPLLLAVLIGGLGSAAIGAILAFIGGRLGALEFGLLTLAFGLFADNFLFNLKTLVPPLTGRDFGTPDLLGLDLSSTSAQYYLFAGILAIALVAVAWYRRRLGAFYIGAGRMNAQLAAATGVEPRTGRIVAFAMASVLSGIGGGLIGIFQQHLEPADITTSTGLVWLAVVVFMGIRSPAAAVIAGVVYAVFPALIQQWLPIRWGPLTTVAFGLGALALAQDPRGVVSLYGKQGKALFGSLRRLRPARARAAA